MKILSIFFVLLIYQNANADWANNFGSKLGANAYAISSTTDSTGNSYLYGYFDGSTQEFGGITLTRIGAEDAYIVKLDSNGNVLWAKNFGGAGASVAPSKVTVDSSGNVYLHGFFYNANLTTPAITRMGNRDAIVIKMDSSGNITWAKSFGGTGVTVTYSGGIAVDSSGNVYINGQFNTGNLTTPALTRIGTADMYVIKLDSNGNTTWSKNYGGSGASMSITGIAVDGSDNPYIFATFFAANLTTPAVSRIGTTDGLAMKLDSSGNTTWTKNFGGSGVLVYGGGFFLDSSSNLYLSGYFNGSNMTTPSLTKIGNADNFVIKMDSSSNITWSKNFGGSGVNTFGGTVSVDGSGNVYSAGYINNNITTPSITKIGVLDAFIVKLDSSGNTLWNRQFGGSGSSAYINSLSNDSSGNIFVLGRFTDASLTTPSISKIGKTDTFVQKLDSSGNNIWTKNFGAVVPTGLMFMLGAIQDAQGNLYFTGYTFTDTINMTFGGFTLNQLGTYDSFVVKTDRNGNVLWAKNIGGFGSAAYAFGIALDNSNNVHVIGSFSANLTSPTLSLIGSSDIFAIKYDTNGNLVWAKNFGGAGVSVNARDIAVDSSSNVYLVGTFSTANLTTPALTRIGTTDTFLIKLDSNGNTTLSKNFGGAGATANVRRVKLDLSGNIYLGGDFQTASLTTPALTKIGTADPMAIKLDSGGNVTWAKNFGGVGSNSFGEGLDIDSSGNVYLGGYIQSANFTTPVITRIGTRDAYVIKLDSNGNTTWSKNFGGAGASTYSYSLNIANNNKIYLSGSFNANITTPALTKIGSTDGFVIQLDLSGNITWSKNFGGVGASTNIETVAVNPFGNLYLGGYHQNASLTTPPLTLKGSRDIMLINIQLFNTPCTTAGKFKFDSVNNVMVFCDGSSWQSMNNSSAATCSGATNGKVNYYSNGASSDFVWHAGSCRSTKSATTFGACPVNGKIEWDNLNSTIRGCINGTWTSLKGW